MDQTYKKVSRPINGSQRNAKKKKYASIFLNILSFIEKS